MPDPEEPDEGPRRPWYQAVLRLIAATLFGVVAAGTLLDSIANALAMINFLATVTGTVLLAALWIITEYRARCYRVLWLFGTRPVLVKSLGWETRCTLAGVLLLLWAPRIFGWHSVDDCGASYMRMEMRINGFPTFRDDPAAKEGWVGGSYFEFLVGNPSSRCTAVVDSIDADILDAASDPQAPPEAVTLKYQFTIQVAPSTRGRVLISQTPRNYSPNAAPEIFGINIVPVEWGYDFAVQLGVNWHDLQTGARHRTTSCTMIAAFPGKSIITMNRESYVQSRDKRLDEWRIRFDRGSCAKPPLNPEKYLPEGL